MQWILLKSSSARSVPQAKLASTASVPRPSTPNLTPPSDREAIGSGIVFGIVSRVFRFTPPFGMFAMFD